MSYGSCKISKSTQAINFAILEVAQCIYLLGNGTKPKLLISHPANNTYATFNNDFHLQPTRDFTIWKKFTSKPIYNNSPNLMGQMIETTEETSLLASPKSMRYRLS